MFVVVVELSVVYFSAVEFYSLTQIPPQPRLRPHPLCTPSVPDIPKLVVVLVSLLFSSYTSFILSFENHSLKVRSEIIRRKLKVR